MTAYIIIFAFSTIFLYFGENKKGISKKLLIFLGLSLPILLAGFRKVGIGTDTEVYVNVLYEAAKNSTNLFDYLSKEVYSSFQYKSIMNWEIGYNLLLYYSTKLTGSIQGVFLITHLIIICFIYSGLKKYKEYCSTAFAMFVFYFMFYGYSLNAMRQWISIAIIFWGTHYLYLERDKLFFIAIAVALLFHNSAIIGIIVWAIYKYTNVERKKSRIVINGVQLSSDLYKILAIIIIGVVCLLGISLIGNLLSSINNVFARYVRIYLSGNIRLMPMQLLRKFPIVFITIINWKKIRTRCPNSLFFLSMLTLDILISQLSGITAQSSRIGYYFSVFELVLISEIVASRKINTRILYTILIGVYIFVGFYYDNVLMGRSEIVPFLFFFD